MNNSSNAAIDPTTSQMPAVALAPEQWAIVSEILRRHLSGREVWAYGSRARDVRVKQYSDLDLAVEGPPLSLADRGALVDAFDESPLPFKVDVVETATLDAGFRTRIEADKVLVMAATPENTGPSIRSARSG
jgi:predicted nucleotidyltransferase